MNKEEIINVIQQSKQILHQHGIKEIGLFGSYVRGEQSSESDIDILIDFIPGEEKFKNLMKAHEILQEAFIGKKIELVTKNGLSPYIGPHILKEVIYV
jgi:uncharacterized protein